ncbi:hypothetical protein [Bradyrhizobium vignae]|uniref:hypothetical protein n=1 Tax=Bradyrhizobium vignae TaxID=1549949 RepID=UPI00100B22F1|nr:hypothetical protein [Bradyrhizobium vignae]RXG85622.1 hypothetical protein EAV90_34960 [Bradyrhizobium vignae]
MAESKSGRSRSKINHCSDFTAVFDPKQNNMLQVGSERERPKMIGKEIGHCFIRDVQLEMPAGGDSPAEPCIVVQGNTEHVYLPISKLKWFDWKIVVLLNAAAKEIGPTERIRRLDSITPDTCTTTRTGDGKVAVIIDHGMESQQTMLLDPAAAAHLGHRLIAAAAETGGSSVKH